MGAYEVSVFCKTSDWFEGIDTLDWLPTDTGHNH